MTGRILGLMKQADLNAKVIEQFRAGGPVEDMTRERLLLLTTVGRRTATKRTTPMMFHRYRGRLLLVGFRRAQ